MGDRSAIAVAADAAAADNEKSSMTSHENDARLLAEQISAEMSVPMDVSVMAVYSTLLGGVGR